jgi:hypothetical protein
MNFRSRPVTTGLPKVVARPRPPVLAPPVLALLIALLSATVLAAGCGGADTPPPGAGGTQPQPTGAGTTAGPDPFDPPDSCQLLTDQEAEAAAGNPVKAGQLMGIICIWEPQDIEDDTHLQLSVAYVPAPPGADVAAVCQASLPGIPDSVPLAGTGLGDSAYWDFDSGQLSNAGSLHICFDGGMVDTAAIGQRPETELQQIAISIARTALGRL